MVRTLLTSPPIEASAKLHYINALRGWAILGVLLVHNGMYGTDLSHFARVLVTFVDQGARGVQLFFVASAFTLFLSMSRRKEEKHPTRNFFLRRFFRIAPMYWLGIAFFSYWYLATGTQPVTVANVVANLTFLHGLNPYWINSLVPGGWSITVEMGFYCLAPLLFARLQTVDQAVRFIAWGVLANWLLTLVLTPLHLIPESWMWVSYLFLYLPSQLPVFGFGILLYLVLARTGEPKTLRPGTWLLVAGAALLVLMTWLPVEGQTISGIALGGLHYWFGAAFFVLALALSQHAPRLLVNPIIDYIGEISFSLYLVHFAVLFVLNRTNHVDLFHASRMATALVDFVLRYVLLLGVSVSISTVFYRAVEVPCQKVGKRLIWYLENR
jgi:peptidoglycan/LPS O-acetylase OafA/YrhL